MQKLLAFIYGSFKTLKYLKSYGMKNEKPALDFSSTGSRLTAMRPYREGLTASRMPQVLLKGG
jgi:hypothetical protein